MTQEITRSQKRINLLADLKGALDLIDTAYGRKNLATEDVMTLTDIRVKCDTVRAALADLGSLDEAGLALFDNFMDEGFALTKIIRNELAATAPAH